MSYQPSAVATDLTWGFAASTDLRTWTPIAPAVDRTSPGPTPDRVTRTANFPALDPATRLFRVSAQLP